MPGEFCFELNGKRTCIPIFVLIRPERWRDPAPWGGIDLGGVLGNPLDPVAGDPRPIPWIEKLGLDLRQQQRLASAVLIADAVEGLSPGIKERVQDAAIEQIKEIKLPESISIRLQGMTSRRAEAM